MIFFGVLLAAVFLVGAILLSLTPDEMFEFSRTALRMTLAFVGYALLFIACLAFAAFFLEAYVFFLLGALAAGSFYFWRKQHQTIE